MSQSKNTKQRHGARAKKASKTTEPITAEEREKLIRSLPSWPQLELRIEQEISNERDKAQARKRIERKIEKQLAKWDAEAMRSEKGKAIRSSHFLAKVQDDSAAKQLALAIQFREQVDRHMAAGGLPADSFERLTNALLFEIQCFWLSQYVARQFPDGQKDLVGALLFMLLNYPRGQYMRTVDEKKRELTAEECEKLNESCESTLRHLPAIVYELMPDEFVDYADSIPDTPERVYTSAAKLYLKLHKQKRGRHISLTGKLDKMIVEGVMRDPDVPQTKYNTFHKGLTREVRRMLLESQEREKARSKKSE